MAANGHWGEVHKHLPSFFSYSDVEICKSAARYNVSK
jgi:hypothetical protein